MNIAGIKHDCVNVYSGIATEIYISGCYHNCLGCHNPELQNFNYGEILNDSIYKELLNELFDNSDWFDIISILGGDLLCQNDEEARYLVDLLRFTYPDKELWLFTGKELDEVPEWAKEFFDVIKTGRYDKDLPKGLKLASNNQKFNYRGIDY